MTHREILEKAIQKANDGGWKISTNRFDEELNTPEYVVKMVFEPCCDEDRIHLSNIIFDHDFARALCLAQLVRLISSKVYGVSSQYTIGNIICKKWF